MNPNSHTTGKVTGIISNLVTVEVGRTCLAERDLLHTARRCQTDGRSYQGDRQKSLRTGL